MIHLMFVASIRFVRDLWPFVLDGHFRWKQTSDVSLFTIVASPCDRSFVMCTSPLAIRSRRRCLSVLDRRSRRKCLFVRDGRSEISVSLYSAWDFDLDRCSRSTCPFVLCTRVRSGERLLSCRRVSDIICDLSGIEFSVCIWRRGDFSSDLICATLQSIKVSLRTHNLLI